MIKLMEPCPRDAYKGEFYREKGDGDLHIPGEGARRGEGRGWGKWRRGRINVSTSLDQLKICRHTVTSIAHYAKLNAVLTGTDPVSIHSAYREHIGTRKRQ